MMEWRWARSRDQASISSSLRINLVTALEYFEAHIRQLLSLQHLDQHLEPLLILTWAAKVPARYQSDGKDLLVVLRP